MYELETNTIEKIDINAISNEISDYVHFIIKPKEPISNQKENITSKAKPVKPSSKKTYRMTNEEKKKLCESFETENNTSPIRQRKPLLFTEEKEQLIECCYSCKSIIPLVISEEGFPTCTQCGIMLTNTLDYSPEWRFFGSEDRNSSDPTRCGNPVNPLLKESSFGCNVMVTPRSTHEMKRIHKWVEWQSMPHKEKALYDEFQYITTMATNAGISKIIIEYALQKHKEMSEQKMYRGLNRQGIIAASIYVACCHHECPRTAQEIAQIFNLDKSSATGGCSMAMVILQNVDRKNKISDNTTQSVMAELSRATPSSYIDRFCSRLSVPEEIVKIAKFVAMKVEKERLIDDNMPHAISAGIIQFLCHYCSIVVTKSDIENVTGVSNVTINKCFKKLDNIRSQLLPRAIMVKYNIPLE